METIAGILVLIAFGALVLSIIALIYPLPKFWLPTRKRAGRVCGLSLVLMVISALFLPEPPPPTPEELAAIAAEKKREAEEAAVRRRAEEHKREMQAGYEEVEERRVAILEWGEEHQYDAEDYCTDKIEELAPHLFRWTTHFIIDRRLFDSWLAIDPKKGVLSFFPEITEETLLAYFGSKIRFSDADGNFRQYRYECVYHPDSENVIRVSAHPIEQNQ